MQNIEPSFQWESIYVAARDKKSPFFGRHYSETTYENDIYGLEINPRFGGGYPFSYNAGANFPKMIIEEFLNQSMVKYDESWKDNYVNLRYEAEITFLK